MGSKYGEEYFGKGRFSETSMISARKQYHREVPDVVVRSEVRWSNETPRVGGCGWNFLGRMSCRSRNVVCHKSGCTTIEITNPRA